MREREHEPADSDGDQNECEERPHGVANALAEFALGQKCERDGNAEREDEHGLEMIQHYFFARLTFAGGLERLREKIVPSGAEIGDETEAIESVLAGCGQHVAAHRESYDGEDANGKEICDRFGPAAKHGVTQAGDNP